MPNFIHFLFIQFCHLFISFWMNTYKLFFDSLQFLTRHLNFVTPKVQKTSKLKIRKWKKKKKNPLKSFPPKCQFSPEYISICYMGLSSESPHHMALRFILIDISHSQWINSRSTRVNSIIWDETSRLSKDS